MDPRPGDRLSDRGFASVQFVVAAALALVVVVWLADALVVRYAEGVMGVAAREAARAGSVDGRASCLAEATAWLDDGLGGSMGDAVSVRCVASPSIVTATVEGTFDAWMPGVAAWEVSRTASAVREP
jgi:hypothetical protein